MQSAEYPTKLLIGTHKQDSDLGDFLFSERRVGLLVYNLTSSTGLVSLDSHLLIASLTGRQPQIN